MSSPTTLFVLLASALTVLVMLRLLWPLWRGVRLGSASQKQLNATVYRDQLQELERDLSRGLLDAAHYEEARDELQRRLLQDVAAAQAVGQRIAERGLAGRCLADAGLHGDGPGARSKDEENTDREHVDVIRRLFVRPVDAGRARWDGRPVLLSPGRRRVQPGRRELSCLKCTHAISMSWEDLAGHGLSFQRVRWFLPKCRVRRLPCGKRQAFHLFQPQIHHHHSHACFSFV